MVGCERQIAQRSHQAQTGGSPMAVLKVIELMADSSKSWEDATQIAVTKAGKSLKGIKSVWVKDFSAKVNKSGKVESYRVNVKLSFEVQD
jgi:dodecin